MEKKNDTIRVIRQFFQPTLQILCYEEVVYTTLAFKLEKMIWYYCFFPSDYTYKKNPMGHVGDFTQGVIYHSFFYNNA